MTTERGNFTRRVWPLPVETPKPPVGGEVNSVPPARMPEFWLRAHQTPDQAGSSQVRGTPYVLRGRDHELAWVGERLNSIPVPVQLIQGAPGTGKTSLLQTIGHYAAARGFRVIELGDAALTSDVTLANAFQDVTNPNDLTPASSTVLEGEQTDAASRGVRHGTEASATRTYDHQQRGVWQAAIQSEANSPRHNGLVILLDEVQLLGQITADSDDRDRIRSFLQFMHNAPTREQPNGSPAMLICAGLPNAEGVLHEYGLTRTEGLDILNLGPISWQACVQIIEDHLNATTHTGESLPRPPKDGIEELARMGQGYPHHISHAAQILQKQAMRAQREGRPALIDADMSTVEAETNDARTAHYEGWVEHRDAKRRITAEAAVIAQATESWGEQLPIERTDKLIRTIEDAAGMPAGALLERLLNSGSLEQRSRPRAFATAELAPGAVEADHYVFAIPTMRLWLITKTEPPNAEPDRREQNQKIIDSVAPPIAKADQIPAWVWNHEKSLPNEVLPLPPDQPWVESATTAIEKPQQLRTPPQPPAGETIRRTSGNIVDAVGVAMREFRKWLKGIWQDSGPPDAAVETKIESIGEVTQPLSKAVLDRVASEHSAPDPASGAPKQVSNGNDRADADDEQDDANGGPEPQ